MDHGFGESGDGLRRYNYRYLHDEPDDRGRFQISDTTQPCPGVALRFSAVIDCTPGEDRMPPVTIEIVNKMGAGAAGDVASPQIGDVAAPPAAEVPQVMVASFRCSSGDFVASSQLRRVEETVVEAGLPRECARSVNEFCRLSAVSASNTFYKSVAITVVADAPGNMVVDEDEVVPDGAETGECSICYHEYVVGGATSMKLPCGHVYHRKCLDKWTRLNATCPYCRRPLPSPEEDYFWNDDDEGVVNGISGGPDSDDLSDEDDHTEADGGNLRRGHSASFGFDSYRRNSNIRAWISQQFDGAGLALILFISLMETNRN